MNSPTRYGGHDMRFVCTPARIVTALLLVALALALPVKEVSAVGDSATGSSTNTMADFLAAAEPCPYPYACYYNSAGRITGKFRDVTSGWQTLTSSRGAYALHNTRHDDVVFTRATNGTTWCTAPETWVSFSPYVVEAMRIRSSPTC
jgi:hypothetical protein